MNEAAAAVEPLWNEGVVLVDKPEGLTSFAIVRRIRRLLGVKKVGHAGTLDPFATGLLIVCVGRAATKHIEALMVGRKTYIARLQLGVETTTLDPEGEVISTRPVPELQSELLVACLKSLVGPQMQAPPPFSAAKHKGKPLYVYARKGIVIEKAPRSIEIHRLDLVAYDGASRQLTIEVDSSRGTYIRVLAADIGQLLGCGAHLVGLRRTRCGPFSVDDSLPGSALFDDDGQDRLQVSRLAIDEVLRLVGQPTLCTCQGRSA